MHRRSLPIAQPCHEDFDAMEPQGSRRFCDRCQTPVHDLSAMTRTEARDFLRQRQGQQVCVRYRTESDGTLRFAPAPPARAAVPVLVAMAGLMAACTGYVDAMDLEVPDGPTCVDAAGYSIPCADAPDVIPVDEVVDVEPEVVDEVVEEVVDVEPPVPFDDDTYVMGGISLDEIEPVPLPEPEEPGIVLGQMVVEYDDEQPEGCPLQKWDDAGEGDVELMGEIEAPRFSRREERKIRRELRRERRGRSRS